jgi:predicted TIM-barrel fold metal-dependent hydrolase
MGGRHDYDRLTHREAARRMLIDTVGVDEVIFGTDWPADMAIDWSVSRILSLQSLTPEEEETILYKNLEKLLGL